MIFAMACLRLPMACSRRPLACWRRVPVTRPAVFLALPLAVAALCLIFLVVLMTCLPWAVARAGRPPGRWGPVATPGAPGGCSAGREQAGRPAGPAGDQVIDEEQDSGPDDGGDPGGQVEESLHAVDVEQLGGDPAACQRPDDADDAGQDEALRPPAGQPAGDQASDQAEDDPCDDAHYRLLSQ